MGRLVVRYLDPLFRAKDDYSEALFDKLIGPASNKLGLPSDLSDHLIFEKLRSVVTGNQIAPDPEIWARLKSRIVDSESLTVQEQLHFDDLVVPLSSIANGAIARANWKSGDTIMYSYPEPETAHELFVGWKLD
jgi:hypothetical protein